MPYLPLQICITLQLQTFARQIHARYVFTMKVIFGFCFSPSFDIKTTTVCIQHEVWVFLCYICSVTTTKKGGLGKKFIKMC